MKYPETLLFLSNYAYTITLYCLCQQYILMLYFMRMFYSRNKRFVFWYIFNMLYEMPVCWNGNMRIASPMANIRDNGKRTQNTNSGHRYKTFRAQH